MSAEFTGVADRDETHDAVARILGVEPGSLKVAVLTGLLVIVSEAFAFVVFIIPGLVIAGIRWLLAPLRRRHGRHRERNAAIDAEADEAVAWFRQPEDPGGSPVPPAAAAEPSPPARAATLPQPPAETSPPSSSGLGQHPFDGHRRQWVIYPDDKAADMSRPEGDRIRGTQFQPQVRETGGLPALIRPAARRHFDRIDNWWTL